MTDSLTVRHPSVPDQVVLDLVRHDRYNMLSLDGLRLVAIVFPGPVEDEDVTEQVAALIGYAWATTGARTKVADSVVIWPDERTVVAHCPIGSRTAKTRTSAKAAADFITRLPGMLVEGSPVRRDGTRAVEGIPARYRPENAAVYC